MGINSLQKLQELNNSYIRQIQITPELLKEQTKKAEGLRAPKTRLWAIPISTRPSKIIPLPYRKILQQKPLFWKNYQLLL